MIAPKKIGRWLPLPTINQLEPGVLVRLNWGNGDTKACEVTTVTRGLSGRVERIGVRTPAGGHLSITASQAGSILGWRRA